MQFSKIILFVIFNLNLLNSNFKANAKSKLRNFPNGYPTKIELPKGNFDQNGRSDNTHRNNEQSALSYSHGGKYNRIPSSHPFIAVNNNIFT